MMLGAATSATTTPFTPLNSKRSHGGISRSSSSCSRISCKAECRSSSKASSYSPYDLYELLGVEKGAPAEEIKKSYRWLQKKCHPDIAGELGHEMSILLNEAYAILSDPASRTIYDKLRDEWVQFDGYTGEPVYSTWFGEPYEHRAIFVNESRCVGCLNCALIASNTFAIEKKFGRARAVSQWGDPEPLVEAAMKSCPVDCISYVTRDNLPALEHIMSKISLSVTDLLKDGYGGANVFHLTEAFLRSNAEFEAKKKGRSSQRQRNAADAVHARAGRWWHYAVGKGGWSEANMSMRSSVRAIVPLSSVPQGSERIFAESKLKELYEVVARQRASHGGRQQVDDYWTPSAPSEGENTTTSSIQPFVTERPQVSSSPSSSASFKRSQQDKPTSARKKNALPLLLLEAAPLPVSLAAGFNVLTANLESTAVKVVSSTPTNVPTGPLRELKLMLVEVISQVGVQALLSALAWYIAATAICTVASLSLGLDDKTEEGS